ncbi:MULTISPECIES: hypothetical protein [Cyanophyceae]|nr:hypothetical protein [Nodosilinea sp. FACHB-131]
MRSSPITPHSKSRLESLLVGGDRSELRPRLLAQQSQVSEYR